ncbi:MAG: hypothetical protein R3211_00905 [Balneolaceae bacterium]|nr:hypothetical protein [Balneolaceae bacterium]
MVNKENYAQWQRIDDTQIYSSGHYLVHQDKVIDLFESGQLDNEQITEEIRSGDLVTTELKSDPRIHFQFFPLKDGEKLVMEIFATDEALDQLPNLLPSGVKKIMTAHDPVQLHTKKIS